MHDHQKNMNFNFAGIFESIFVPIWIEDIAPLYRQFEVLRQSGVTDLAAYLRENPSQIYLLAEKVEVVDVNQASVALYGARNKEEFLGQLNKLMCTIDQEKFAAALVSFWNQDEVFSMETTHQTFDGKPMATIISARIPRFESDDLIIPVTITDITALREKQESLTTALEEIKTLRGIIPICASCKSIRDGEGYWNELEKYISDRTDAQFTHGICPDCSKRLFPIEKRGEG